MSGPARSAPTDESLVGRALEQDEEAWDLLLDRYGAYIYAIAVRGFRLKPEEAEDVFQETTLALYQHLPTFRGEGSLRAWIGRIAQNASRAYLRRQGRRLETPSDSGIERADAAQEVALREVEDGLVVREALERLAPECRQVLTRFFYERHKYREIAAALGIPEGTVATRISRCLVQLRVLLNR